MDDPICKSCPAKIESGTAAKICANCERMLGTGIKILSGVWITLVILAACTALTAVVFFFIAASRGGDPSRFRVGAGRNAAAATPTQMFVGCGFMILFAIGMFIGSYYAKRTKDAKEAEYKEMAGKAYVPRPGL